MIIVGSFLPEPFGWSAPPSLLGLCKEPALLWNQLRSKCLGRGSQPLFTSLTGAGTLPTANDSSERECLLGEVSSDRLAASAASHGHLVSCAMAKDRIRGKGEQPNRSPVCLAC